MPSRKYFIEFFLVKVITAYTQGRFRQMIFGGTTSHILANASLPVFMAH